MFRIGEKHFRLGWLEGCGLALLLCLALAPGALAQQHGTLHLRVRQTATQSLTLITPSDPLFEGTLDTYFPGLSQENGYQKSIQPFLVLVRNDTALTAMAYAITWKVNYTNGSVGAHRAIFLNRPLMNLGSETILRPGQIRLIAPMYNVTPKDYESFHSFAQFYPAKVYPGSEELVSVDVEVDGVVYNDGTFIGPDKTHLLQRYVMAKFAARDEVLAALKFIQSSTVPQAMILSSLAQMLNQHSLWGLREHKSTLLARYIRARGRTARDLETILRNRGLSGLETALQNFVNFRSRGNSNPSMFGGIYEKLSANNPSVLVP